MLQGEHSAILSKFVELPLVIKIFVLSIFEWLFSQVLLYPEQIFQSEIQKTIQKYTL